jgi:hypothetical protein
LNPHLWEFVEKNSISVLKIGVKYFGESLGVFPAVRSNLFPLRSGTKDFHCHPARGIEV